MTNKHDYVLCYGGVPDCWRVKPEDLPVAVNELKKTGISKIVIGDPWSPDSGNWIHVTVYYTDVVRRKGSIETTTRAQHTFKVESFDQILSQVLAFSAKFQEATHQEEVK